ncbi:MAG: hypothetical protein U9O78_03350 [Patescibacteria group bacterium]|nr:hypothetical protein [Patescibacteria group bacterium]
MLNIPPTEIYYNLGSVLGALRLIDRFIKKHGIDSSIYGFTHLVDSEYSPATADDRLSIVEILVQKLVENGYCRIDEENNLLLTPGTPGLMKATTIARLAGATRASIKIFTELLADLRSEQFCSLELAKTEVAKLVELGELSADWAYWLLPEHTIKSQLVFDRAVVGDNGFESLTLTLFRNFQELFDKLELEVFRYSSAHISNYFDNPYTSQDPKARNKELLLTFVRPFFSSMVLMILSGENDQIITDATPEDREQYGVQNSKGVIVTAKSKAVAMLLNLIKEFDNLVAANKESEIYDLMDQMKIVLKEYEESNTVKSDLDEKSATQLVKPLLKDGLSSCLLLTPPSMEDYSPKRIADVLNLTEEQYVQWVQRAVDVNIETHKEAGSTVDTQSREPMSQEEIKRLVREKLLEFNTFVSLPEREAEEVLSMIVEIVNNWLHPIEKGSPEIIGVKKKRFLTPFLDIIEQIIAFFKRRF